MIAVTRIEHLHRNHIAAYSRMIWASVKDLNEPEHGGDDAVVTAWAKNATYALLHADHAYVACTPAGGLCGVSAMTLAMEARITVLYVNPALPRKGVGALLLDHMIGVAKKHMYQQLHVDSSFVGGNFYLKKGFTWAGIPKRGVGQTWDYPMILDLRSHAASAVPPTTSLP